MFLRKDINSRIVGAPRQHAWGIFLLKNMLAENPTSNLINYFLGKIGIPQKFLKA